MSYHETVPYHLCHIMKLSHIIYVISLNCPISFMSYHETVPYHSYHIVKLYHIINGIVLVNAQHLYFQGQLFCIPSHIKKILVEIANA